MLDMVQARVDRGGGTAGRGEGFSENETMPNACSACAALVQSSPRHSSLSSLSQLKSLLRGFSQVNYCSKFDLLCWFGQSWSLSTALAKSGLTWPVCVPGAYAKEENAENIFGIVFACLLFSFPFFLFLFCILFLTATKCVSVFFLLSTVWPELLLLLLLVLLDGLLRLWLTRCRRFTSAWSNKMIASDFLCKLLCCCSYCCCVVSWVMRIFFFF